MSHGCVGITKAGEPCAAHPRKGTDRCWRHMNTANTPHARPERWDRQAWLTAFESSMMVSEACKIVGVGRTAVYEERQRNEMFALAWHDIEERVTERLEAEMFRRAHDGVEKMIVSAGKKLGTEQQFSDSLLMFMLKSKRPDRYRDNVKVEHSGKVETIGTGIILNGELARDARELLRRAAAPSGD